MPPDLTASALSCCVSAGIHVEGNSILAPSQRKAELHAPVPADKVRVMGTCSTGTVKAVQISTLCIDWNLSKARNLMALLCKKVVGSSGSMGGLVLVFLSLLPAVHVL